MDALLNNADVDQIWCECMDLTLVDDARPHRDILEPSKQPYAVLTLTDGTHVDEALAFPAANLAGGVAGQRVRARKHRVQWTNGKRQWFIFEGSLGEVGRAPAARAPAGAAPGGRAAARRRAAKEEEEEARGGRGHGASWRRRPRPRPAALHPGPRRRLRSGAGAPSRRGIRHAGASPGGGGAAPVPAAAVMM